MATLTVRISDEMHEDIKKAAAEDVRSVNAEIIWLLGTALSVRATAKKED